ncbi:MAG: membrane integrity-associated transporter subunit PqiC [Rhodopila sp.]
MRRHRPLACAVAMMAWAAALTGCSSPNPARYTIGVQDGPIVQGAPKVIELRDIGLAGYLDRPQIVRSSDGYRLDIMANDTWGEPLGGMIARVLSIELAQRLPGSNVYSGRSAIAGNADAVIEVNIQRMDATADGNLMLLAQVAVRFRNKPQPVARTVTISRPLAGVSTADEVAAISAALADLADGLATMLRQQG